MLNSFYKVPKLAELFQGNRAKFIEIILATIPKDENDCINFDDVMKNQIENMDIKSLKNQFNAISSGHSIDEEGLLTIKTVPQENKIYEFVDEDLSGQAALKVKEDMVSIFELQKKFGHLSIIDELDYDE